MTPKLNILVSWPYWTDRAGKWEAEEWGSVRLLIDSGAFSAWKHGLQLNVQDYCEFIKSGLPVKPWRYFVLDVVGDPVATRRNYETMLDAGLTPIPIFTRGTDFDELARYYETSDLVGLGGLVGTPQAKGYVRRFMREAGTHDVHWLGLPSGAFISYYQPYSCDASNWAHTGRWGFLKLYAGKGRFLPWGRNKANVKPSRAMMDAIQSYGVDPRELALEANWHGVDSIGRNLGERSMLRWGIDIEDRFGTRVFLAMGFMVERFPRLIEGFRSELERRHEGRAVLGRA